MSSEEHKFIVNLTYLNPSTREKIMSYHTDQSTLIEDAVKQYFKSDEAFEDVLHCPVCYVTLGRKISLRGLPILEAEKHGFISLCNDKSRKRAKEAKMYFGVCPECLWWGTPDSESLRLP